jgi:hypothetical protein
MSDIRVLTSLKLTLMSMIRNYWPYWAKLELAEINYDANSKADMDSLQGTKRACLVKQHTTTNIES